ncbi:hypothetical protein BV22DRAFT_1111516 [Leucogyrophana mollusca]|uniref:Uncharacterized protein n=1 Tax=Leucogyrophana mollusca TaxID=85980 RepID=A0ACB8BMI5_9AGAM|nr:hypothetical protein BV22DRAFT_1111516 [Leucogyrophana mollusca]
MLKALSLACGRGNQSRKYLHVRPYSSHGDSSSSSNPFPYPTQPFPLPHHIFHLPRNPSKADVKRRYYELVRIYHPDSPVARHYPPEVSQARFQAITKAYDVLRGKSALTGETLGSQTSTTMDPARWATGTRQSGRPHFDDTSGDERWKERTIMAAAMLTIAAFVIQTTITRQQAIAEAAARRRPGPSSNNQSRTDDTLADNSRS